MKTALSLLASVALATTALASAGPGPWANSTWYPGNIDGKYQAAIYGNNISGVLAFALANGSVTIATNSTIVNTNSIQTTISFNPLQNYYAVFVEGVAYANTAMASMNFNKGTVNGVLMPAGPLTGGYFQANIDGNGGVFTFSGTGSVSIVTNALLPPPPQTKSVPFNINGIRVSFSTTPY